MKRVLIIGTSHSEANCQRQDNEPIEIVREGRWHDYFKDHGWEVVNISRGGCSTQMQFMATASYFHDNPDAHFDLALVEGRSMETNVSIPTSFTYAELNHGDFYKHWLDDHPTKKGDVSTLINADSHFIEKFPEYQGWYADYVHSLTHATDLWAANYALCSLISKYATVVKWFTFSASMKFVVNPNQPQITLGYDIMKDYILEDTWPWINFDNMPDDAYCYCKHLNEKGHKIFWDDYIFPRIKKICDL